MRIRQVVIAARELAPVVDDLRGVLGLEVGFKDPGVRVFGLDNAVLPVGDTFLEVISPVDANTAAGRFLDRRGGDGGYMVIVQTNDTDGDRARMARLGVRTVWSIDLDDIRAMHLHPRDVGGAILSLDSAVPPASWRWAGPEWREHVRTERVRTVTGVDLESPDPSALARRWGEVLDREVAQANGHAWTIALDGGTIRFLTGAREGVAAFELAAADRDAIVAAARTRGLPCTPDSVEIGGTTLRLR